MPKTIISDTSCLIILSNIGELQLLQNVYGQVFTTVEIAQEFGEFLPEWIVIKGAADIYKQQLLELQIDKGESSAIALALEMSNSTLILDDNKARKIANQLGLHVTGTMGIIVRAKLNGIIPSIRPLLEKIRKTNFRLSVEIETLALKAAQE